MFVRCEHDQKQESRTGAVKRPDHNPSQLAREGAGARPQHGYGEALALGADGSRTKFLQQRTAHRQRSTWPPSALAHDDRPFFVRADQPRVKIDG